MDSNKLYSHTRQFLLWFEKAHGKPERNETPVYWQLKATMLEIEREIIASHVPKKKKVYKNKIVIQQTLRVKILLVIAMFSCWRTVYKEAGRELVIAECMHPAEDLYVVDAIISFKRNGSIDNIILKRDGILLTLNEIKLQTEITRRAAYGDAQFCYL